MMKVLRINGIELALDESEELLAAKVAAILDISVDDIVAVDVIKEALDARRHRAPRFVYALRISVSEYTKLPAEFKEGLPSPEEEYKSETPTLSLPPPPNLPVVVIGSGPAGLFAAYVLALRNIPVILLERGAPIEERVKDVRIFWKQGILNPRSNVLFGEGGAGTFSDGKLTSRTKNPYALWVKKILVQLGASSEIIVEAKPHIGTDKLRQIIVNLRKTLLEMGCKIEFKAQATDFLMFKENISAVVINEKEEIKTDNVILAIGQSADDTYWKLFECGVKMESDLVK
jgi:hypothetical protein